MLLPLAPLLAALATPPQDLSDRFEHPPGLTVALWAESPLLYNPTALDVDAEGNVWVAEGVRYRRWGGRNPGPEREAGDRIVRLVDVDRDGDADRADVFVQDPDLVAPLGLCVLGSRVLVSCSPNVFLYTDDDGDGRADRRETFLTGFGGFDHDHGVHSFVEGDDGWLYVAVGNAGPHLVDGVDGFHLRSGSCYTGGTPYNDHNTPGLESSDGRVWTGGLVLRVRPDGTGLSVVGHNFRNPYEVARDSLGNLYTADNDDDGNRSVRTAWVLPGANYGFFSADGARTWRLDQRPGQEVTVAHWHADDPGVMPTWTINGAGGPTGVAVYECEFFDDDMAPFDGAVLNADAGAGVVYAHLPRRRGANLELLRTTFLGRTPESGRDAGDAQGTWFRPSDVVVAPDGSVFVADWYDPGVGGHGAGDRAAYGRILRVAAAGAPPACEPVRYGLASDAEVAADEHLRRPESRLLNALASPALHVRARAREELLALGDGAFDALHELAGDPSARIAARAVQLLARLSDRGRAFVEQAAHHPTPELRAVAYAALCDVGAPSAVAHRHRLASDVSPFVRAAVARSLRDLPADECLEDLVALALLYEGGDRVYVESLGLGADSKEEALFARLLELRDAGQLDDARLRDLAWRLHPEAAVPLLAAWAADPTLERGERLRMLDALGFVPPRAAADAMFLAAHVGPQDTREAATFWLRHNARGIWRDHGIDPGAGERFAGATRRYASDLVRAGGVVEVDVDVTGARTVWLVVGDGGDGNSCDWADWIAPRFLLADGGDAPLAALPWLDEESGWGDTAVGRNAGGGPLRIGPDEFAEGLGTHAPARIAYAVPAGATRLVAQAGLDAGGTNQGCGSTVTFEVWSDADAGPRPEAAHLARLTAQDATPGERAAAARALAATRDGALALLALADDGALAPAVQAEVAPLLRRHTEPDVRALASARFPDAAAATFPSAAELCALAGDPERGREVFRSPRAQCATCHAVDGLGRDIGPDLSRIREKYGCLELLESVLEPSKAIAFGYDAYVLRTTDGLVLAGFLLADGDDVVLRDARGERHVVPRDEVDVLARQDVSVMPQGVALDLSPQELADLAAFLLEDRSREPVFGPDVRLFDTAGRTLAGFTWHLADASVAPEDVWSIDEHGVLRCAGRPAGYLRTERTFTNFELELDWRFDPARGPGNSGVLLRTVGPDVVWPKSIEAQLQSGSAGDLWNIGEFPMLVDAARTQGRRTARLLPSNERPLGEWNHYRIRLCGGELTVEVNGRVQNTATWCEEVPGSICLQSEGAWIEFRDLVVRELVE